MKVKEPAMAPDLLAEILKTVHDASFGYCSVNTQLYHKHVSALISDRNDLVKRTEDLTYRIDTLAATINKIENAACELEKETRQYRAAKELAEGEIRRLRDMIEKITDNPSG